MSLVTLRARIASERGINLSASTDYLDSQINLAGRELFNSYDLPNSLDEMLVTLGSDAYDKQRVSLPWQVAKVRAVMDDAQDYQWDLLDIRHSYQEGTWRPPYYGFRVVKSNAALSREIVDTGPLTFTLSAVEADDVSITINGKGANGSRIAEVVIINAGSLAATTTKAYFDVYSINKHNVTTADITVTDILGNTVSFIPNFRQLAKFTWVNIQQRGQSYGQDKVLRVLYKMFYPDMVEEYDTFICGEEYEDIIYWETLSRLWSSEDSDGAADKALLAKQRSLALLERIINDEDRTKQVRASFGMNRYSKANRFVKHAGIYQKQL